MIFKFLLPIFIIFNAYANDGEKILNFCMTKRAAPIGLNEMIKNNRHIDLEVRDSKYQGTPLIWCTITGKWKFAEMLLQNGAEPNAINNDKQSALTLAAKFGHVKLVNSLISTGANKKLKDKWNYSAADWANQAGHYKIVAMIGEKPENIIPFNKKQIKKAYEFLTEVSSGIFPVKSFLIRFKGYGNLIDEAFLNGSTLLHHAAYEGKIPLLKAALQLRADPDIGNKLGTTALMMAASAGQSMAVEILIKGGADPNLKNKEGKTALDYAQGKTEVAIIEFTNRKSRKDRSTAENAVKILKEYKRPAKMALLVQKNMDKIQNIAKKKRREKFALKAIESRDSGGLADMPYPGRNKGKKNSPYMSWAGFNAVWANDYGMLKSLLNKGLNTEVMNKKKNTLLHLAVVKAKNAIVDLLVTRGANLNARNIYGMTPLMLAARHNRVPAVFYLLESGANKRIKNNNGWVAARFAQQARNRRTFNALRF